MPDKDASTPRVFLARHGETTWSQTSRFTGTTELPLTSTGTLQVLSTASTLIGLQKLIDPRKLAHVYISPRQRAQVTFELFFGRDRVDRELKEDGKVETTESLAEWAYGLYEGLLPGEIRQGRRERGLEGDWNIWRDGCEGGENPQQVSDRLDELIRSIQTLQAPCMHGEKPADVVLIAHGHILRAFAKRWLRYPMEFPLSMMIEPGGIGILSYQHHNIAEPAFLLGMAIPPLPGGSLGHSPARPV